MINLFTSYFKTNDSIRQQEVDQCLINNINNSLINRIFIVLDQDIPLTELPVQMDGKATVIYIRKRPTYNVFFELMRQYSGPEGHNMIANSDIYFDSTLALLTNYPPNYCLALTRWEDDGPVPWHLNRADSQDVWIIKGKPREVQGDFPLGRPGCDNAIADRFAKAGYMVVNPSKTIKTYHLHTTKERTYNLNSRVPQPYKFLTPTE